MLEVCRSFSTKKVTGLQGFVEAADPSEQGKVSSMGEERVTQTDREGRSFSHLFACLDVDIHTQNTHTQNPTTQSRPATENVASNEFRILSFFHSHKCLMRTDQSHRKSK